LTANGQIFHNDPGVRPNPGSTLAQGFTYPATPPSSRTASTTSCRRETPPPCTTRP
jgi:hypothetical protein